MSTEDSVPSCVFCRIIDGSVEGSFVVETPDVVAFLDLHPVNAGHTLVVPRAHAPNLADLGPDVGVELFRTGQRVAVALRRDFGYEGVNLHLADGELAGQEVPHVHLHVIPRTRSDALTITNTAAAAARADLDRTADKLRRAGS